MSLSLCYVEISTISAGTRRVRCIRYFRAACCSQNPALLFPLQHVLSFWVNVNYLRFNVRQEVVRGEWILDR
jgi:hypothetical protein